MSAEILTPFRIAPATGEPVEEIVELLTELLDKAKRGEIMAFLACSLHPASGIRTIVRTGRMSRLDSLAAVTILQHDLLHDCWDVGSTDIPIPPPAS